MALRTVANRMTTYCVLVIPAYNEAASIGRCLTSVLESPLPTGFEWREWRVTEDGSSDDTREQVRLWASNHPSVKIHLLGGSARLGKVAAVGKCHDQLVAEGRIEEIIVFIDADSTIQTQTMAALLSEFNDREVAAATGFTIPSRRQFGCRGSAFQIELAGNYARALGPNAYRLEGQFYAYRLGAFVDFRLKPGFIVEETQFVSFIRDRNLRLRSAFGAVVRRTPPGNYVDFYKQTYRAFRAAQLGGGRFPTSVVELHPLAVRVLLRTMREDPVGAISYVLARGVAAILHRFRPASFTDQFPPSPSTKN